EFRHAIEGLPKAIGVGNLEDEAVQLVVRPLVFFAHEIRAAEFIKCGADRNNDRRVLASEWTAASPSALVAATSTSRRSPACKTEFSPAFVFFAFIVLEDPDDPEGPQVDRDHFADGGVVGPLGPELVDDAAPNDSHVLRGFHIEPAEIPADFDLVLVDRHEIR